jgi:hypothetical protein
MRCASKAQPNARTSSVCLGGNIGPLAGVALCGVMGGATGSERVCANPFHRLLVGLPAGLAFGVGASLF